MKKTKRMLAAFLAGFLSIGQMNFASAAPSDIYGTIVMDGIKYLLDEAKDADGNYIVAPETTKFNIEKNYGEAVLTNGISVKKSVDTISSATGGGGGGGIGAARATVVFDFDMLSNAMILKNLGMENQNSKAFLGAWDSAEKNYLTKKGMVTGVSWWEYTNKAIDAYGQGKDLSIEEYIKQGAHLSCLPGEARYILEDGRFTRAIGREVLSKKTHPKISISSEGNLADKNLEIKFLSDFEELKSSLEKIETYGDPLSSNDYSFGENAIIINKDKLRLGKNTITIESNVFRTITITLDRFEAEINPTVEHELRLGSPVVISGLTEAYVNRLNKVVLNGKLLEKNKEWFAEKNQIKLSEKYFNQKGYYAVTLEGSNTAKKLFFSLGLADNNVPDTNRSIPKLNSRAVGFEDDIIIEFDKQFAWQKSVYEVNYNGKIVPYSLEEGRLTLPIADTLEHDLRRDNGEYEVTIKAKGYPDAKVTVETLREAPELKLKEIAEANKPFNLWINQFEGQWEKNIKNVYIDGVELKEGEAYKKGSYGVMFSNKAVQSGGKHTLVIRSAGFTNYVREIYFKGKQDNQNRQEAPVVNASNKDNVRENNIVLTFDSSSNWQKSIEKININGLPIAGYQVGEKEIKIPGVVFNEGKNSIQILAKGFETVNLEQYILKTVPRYVRMRYDRFDWSDYLPEIEGLLHFNRNKIILNGIELKPEQYYYNIYLGNLSLNSETLDQLILNVGQNEMVLELEGYKPVRFNFNLVASHEDYDATSYKEFYVAIGNRKVDYVKLNGNLLAPEDYKVESEGFISIRSTVKTLKMMNEAFNQVTVGIEGKEYPRGQFTLKNLEKELATYNPKANFRTQDTLVAPGQEVSFENLSTSNAAEFEWHFEGANIETSTEKNPTVTYSHEGSYKVTLKAKNEVSEDVMIKETYITVKNEMKDGLKILSMNKTVASSYDKGSYEPSNAVDGNEATYWESDWQGPHYITVDLANKALISEVELVLGRDYDILSNYTIEISVDGEHFEEVIAVNNNANGLTRNVFAAREARYIRLNLLKSHFGDSRLHVNEIRVKGLSLESEILPEELKVEEPKIEEPKAEEPKAEEPKVEEPKVEEANLAL